MKVSICIPAYNQGKTIIEAIYSVVTQDYATFEILLVDDCSTDDTIRRAMFYPVRIIKNEKNLGIGGNLTKCVQEAKGEYIIFLCGDDTFTHQSVIGDMVSIFERYSNVAVIGRPYYQYIDGYPGAVNRVAGNALVDYANPSGVGYRKHVIAKEFFSPRIFIENTSMVKKVLDAGWKSAVMEYDTVAVRLYPGNTCVTSKYYNEPPVLSVRSMIPGYINYQSFISIKNRAPHLLAREIIETVKGNSNILFSPVFWFYALIAIYTPRWLLIRLCNFYRHRIQRRFCDIELRSGKEST